VTDAGTTPATTSAEEPLVALLRRREWPERSELLARFVAYRQTHGAWDDSLGYSEGSLARVIEAALAVSPLLPSVKADSDFLCGMEFDSVRAELAFFRRVSRLPSPVLTILIAIGCGVLRYCPLLWRLRSSCRRKPTEAFGSRSVDATPRQRRLTRSMGQIGVRWRIPVDTATIPPRPLPPDAALQQPSHHERASEASVPTAVVMTP